MKNYTPQKNTTTFIGTIFVLVYAWKREEFPFLGHDRTISHGDLCMIIWDLVEFGLKI